MSASQGGAWEPGRSLTVLDAFDRFDESLLILGEPGAGKTSMLLELASAVLDRAGDNGPLPVLVELGAWRPAGRRTAPLPDNISDAGDAFCVWVLGQVQATYSIGADIAAAWLDQRGLVLLLDGLDEVAARLQAECVKQINGLQTRYPRLRIAVTSRSEQYGRLPDPLALRGALSAACPAPEPPCRSRPPRPTALPLPQRRHRPSPGTPGPPPPPPGGPPADHSHPSAPRPVMRENQELVPGNRNRTQP